MLYLRVTLHIWFWHYLLGRRPRFPRIITDRWYSAPECRSIRVSCECGYSIDKHWSNY